MLIAGMTQKDVVVLVPVSIHKFWEIYFIEFEYWKDLPYLLKCMWNKCSSHLLKWDYSVLTDAEAWATLQDLMLLFPELLQEFEPLDYHADDIKDTVLPGEVT